MGRGWHSRLRTSPVYTRTCVSLPPCVSADGNGAVAVGHEPCYHMGVTRGHWPCPCTGTKTLLRRQAVAKRGDQDGTRLGPKTANCLQVFKSRSESEGELDPVHPVEPRVAESPRLESPQQARVAEPASAAAAKAAAVVAVACSARTPPASSATRQSTPRHQPVGCLLRRQAVAKRVVHPLPPARGAGPPGRLVPA